MDIGMPVLEGIEATRRIRVRTHDRRRDLYGLGRDGRLWRSAREVGRGRFLCRRHTVTRFCWRRPSGVLLSSSGRRATTAGGRKRPWRTLEPTSLSATVAGLPDSVRRAPTPRYGT